MGKAPPRIALFWDTLRFGGMHRTMLTLAESFLDRGIETEIVLLKRNGKLAEEVPSEAWITSLGVQRFITSPLAQYLWQQQPPVLLSAATYTNRYALLARALSRASTSVVISEHAISTHSGSGSVLPSWARLQLTKLTYPFADRVVAVSGGVADNMSQTLDLRREEIEVIYNPVIGPETSRRAEENVDHPWFSDRSNPVIIGVGRLVEEKDFSTLLRAFAIMYRKRDAGKLVILGEGERRSELERLADNLEIRDQVWLPGFVRNPLKYMARSDVFVFSSREEGLGNALIEAMACGTPVVSTNCPGGPAEVLKDGKHGRLVPVGDPAALASAIEDALGGHVASVSRSALDQFRQDTVAEQYLDILSSAAQERLER